SKLLFSSHGGIVVISDNICAHGLSNPFWRKRFPSAASIFQRTFAIVTTPVMDKHRNENTVDIVEKVCPVQTGRSGSNREARSAGSAFRSLILRHGLSPGVCVRNPETTFSPEA